MRSIKLNGVQIIKKSTIFVNFIHLREFFIFCIKYYTEYFQNLSLKNSSLKKFIIILKYNY
jgi:hypothetical protein